MCLCSSGTHTRFCVFSVCRNVTSSLTVAAVLNTSQLRAEANNPRCDAVLAPTLMPEHARNVFFRGVCKFRIKNIFDFFQPSHTRALANENILDGAACQTRGKCWMTLN